MSFTKKQREIIHKKYNCRCGYCGKEISMKEMQVDHMHPLSFPTKELVLFEGVEINKVHHPDNLMPTCRRCNHYKRAETVEGFRKSMLTLHQRIMKNYIVKVAVDHGMLDLKPFNGNFYFETLIPQQHERKR